MWSIKSFLRKWLGITSDQQEFRNDFLKLCKTMDVIRLQQSYHSEQIVMLLTPKWPVGPTPPAISATSAEATVTAFDPHMGRL